MTRALPPGAAVPIKAGNPFDIFSDYARRLYEDKGVRITSVHFDWIAVDPIGGEKRAALVSINVDATKDQ